MKSRSNCLISIEGLTKSYRSEELLSFTMAQKLLGLRKSSPNIAFRNLNFELFSGECVSLLGPNGSGKSSLLKCVAGVSHPTSGKITKNGKILSILTHGLGAYEELPLWKNILLIQQLFGIDLNEAIPNTSKIAEIAGVEQKLFAPSTQLSEGMRAKIPLTCLQFAKFDVVLLDESLNHLDHDYKESFHFKTRQWLKEGKSILFTSHEQPLIEQYSTRSLHLRDFC